MEFVDYYAALNLGRSADAKQIRKAFLEKLESHPDPDNFALTVEAYGVLRNRYKRARYDRSIGYLMVVQAVPENYYSAACYQLLSTKPTYGFKKLINYFKDWVTEKYSLTWEDAQASNYNYQFKSEAQNPYVIFRFPLENNLTEFAKYLLEIKAIRNHES